MMMLTLPDGREEAVTLRRSESVDAAAIEGLMGESARAVFGRINVIHLLEKANLAVTVAGEEDQVLGHASFFDHPVGGLVDATQWETFVQKHFGAGKCTTLNTLFLHLFVAQPDFASPSLKEILRAVFNSVVELEFVFLLSPHLGDPEVALKETFKPLQRRSDHGPHFISFMCRRGLFCPMLRIRSARVEDHDDIMRLFEEQTSLQLNSQLAQRPFFLSELIEAQDLLKQTAVCENDSVTVGFLSATSDIDLQLLQDFDLSEFEGLFGQSEDNNDDNNSSTSGGGGAAEGAPQATPTQPETNQEAENAEQPSEEQQEEAEEAEPPEEKPNAFAIQLFVINKTFEMRSADFMPYVFKVFPEMDYCVMTVPTVSSELPLLQSFVRAPRRTTSQLPCELYICSRSSLSSVEVKPAVPADRRAVVRLVTELRANEAPLLDFKMYCEAGVDREGRRLQAYVVRVNRQLVGLLILRDEEDLEYVRARFNVESFVYFSQHAAEEQALLRHFLLQRSLQHLSRHVLKDALRLSRRSCLYLRVYPPEGSPENSCVHHLDAVLNCVVPVRPRRQIVYPLESLGANAPSRRITQDQPPFTLSLLSRKLTMEPKVVINARIVVVGASATALSFLEVLCFCPHLRFNNLTLVSTHGFPGNSPEDAAFLSTSHASSSRDFDQQPLHYCVSVVAAKMVAINRKCRFISLSTGGRLSYDHLVLCTGLQYQVLCLGVNGGDDPPPARSPTPSDLLNDPLPARSPAPSNLLTLNDPHDCVAARCWLSAHFLKLQNQAVVYGSSLDVFTVVEKLLALGVAGSRLHLVLTPPSGPGTSCFGDPAVEAAVLEALSWTEVQVHRDLLLLHVNDGEEEPLDLLTSVTFSRGTDGEQLRLECGVLLNLSNRGVDRDAFRSINDSFLVFDSRLVVDASFCTNDPAIFGAGPLTKFSCGYHADRWSHAHFSSRQVGQELAAALLPMFDPTLEAPEEPSAQEERLVPLYQQPKIQGGKLPVGFYYLHVSRPRASDDPGGPAEEKERSMVTGRPELGNYFRLQLDPYQRLETLTCLSWKPLPITNYLSLFGKHQRLLGQLSLRYQQGLVSDLYSFFTQSWCLAVCHDRFSDFEQELQELAASQADGELVAAVRSGAVKYLNYNRNLLPMFAFPGQV
ncbi:cilia- and flagella-associated protein 61 isoform X2 [Nelusetta ayraudi]|uniref:cilia- and flagella-associated protein 61 isoform X2 n=1 Tax=Nelusetta ayraudi TaxID=303726 RepID=UPI003F729CA4